MFHSLVPRPFPLVGRLQGVDRITHNDSEWGYRQRAFPPFLFGDTPVAQHFCG